LRSNTLTTQIVVRQTPKLKDKREAYTNRCSRTLLPKWSIMISFRRSLPRLAVSTSRKRTPNTCPRANTPPSVTSPHHTCPRKHPPLRPKLTPQKLNKLSPQPKLVSYHTNTHLLYSYFLTHHTRQIHPRIFVI